MNYASNELLLCEGLDGFIQVAHIVLRSALSVFQQHYMIMAVLYGKSFICKASHKAIIY